MRRGTRSALGLLTALALLACDDEAPPPVQAGWPRPVPGTRIVLLIRSDAWRVRSDPADPREDCTLNAPISIAVEPSDDGEGCDLLVVHGHLWQRARFGVPGGDHEVPAWSDRLVGVPPDPGSRSTVRLDGASRALGAPPPVVVHVPPPPGAPEVGTTWEAALPLPGPLAASRDVPTARCRIEAIEDQVIRVAIDWPDTPLATNATVSGVHLTLDVSRRDGLAIAGTYWTEVVLPARDGEASREIRLGVDIERLPPQTPSPRAAQVDAWIEDLCASAPAQRREAARGLARTWPDGARAVPVLLAAREDDDESVREAAAEALETLGGRAECRLLGLPVFTAREQRAFDAAVLGLMSLERPVHPREVLASPASESTRATAVLLGLLPEPPDAAVSLVLADLARRPFEGGLDLTDPILVECAARGLGVLVLGSTRPYQGKTMLPGLHDFLDDGSGVERAIRVALLRNLGPGSDEVVAAVRAMADDDLPWVRATARRFLERARVPPAGPVRTRHEVSDVEALARTVDGAPDAWRDLLAGLSTAGESDRTRALLVKRDHRRDTIQGWLDACDALGRMHTRDAGAVAALEHAAADGYPLLRYHAARALRRIRAP